MKMVKQNPRNGANLADGALAGLAATVPMSITMLVLHRVLPKYERYPLPPELITAEMAERVSAERAQRGRLRDILSVISHFGFGAATGSLYVPLARISPFPSIISGLVYGFLVWFVSYQGWIPRAKILPPASEQPARRNLLMVLAHFVWGSTLALSLRRLAVGKGKPKIRIA